MTSRSLPARVKQGLPWPVKIAAKMTLARLPVPYSFWKRLSLFEHGAMDDPDYVLGVVREHLAAVGGSAEGLTVLELGPGDSIASAIVLAALGARRSILVDAGAFAEASPEPYARLADALRAGGVQAPDLQGATSLADVLRRCRADYQVGGLESLRSLPEGSVDLVWSHAVLEHVRLHEVAPTLVELRRVMRPDGVASHHIDLRDHLADSLHSLRFRSGVWESAMVTKSGFYTNRLRASQWQSLFDEAGYRIEDYTPRHWPAPPVARTRLARPFRGLSDDDLTIYDIQIRARPATGSGAAAS